MSAEALDAQPTTLAVVCQGCLGGSWRAVAANRWRCATCNGSQALVVDLQRLREMRAEREAVST